MPNDADLKGVGPVFLLTAAYVLAFVDRQVLNLPLSR